MTTLSVILITKNESSKIRRCLDSVSWADEIIVVDSHSTDTTTQIAKEYTSKVFSYKWLGYGPQKQKALEHASCTWVLSIDADEQLSPELKEEIQQTLKNPTHDAYKIRRPLIFANKRVRFANGMEFITRLFKRKNGSFSNDSVHEKILVNGSVGQLNQALFHHSFESPFDLLEKLNTYSNLNAERKFQLQKTSSLTKAITHGLWMFFKSYFLKLGFLDGTAGFVLCFSYAEGSYYHYLKLMYMHQKTTSKK